MSSGDLRRHRSRVDGTIPVQEASTLSDTSRVGSGLDSSANGSSTTQQEGQQEFEDDIFPPPAEPVYSHSVSSYSHITGAAEPTTTSVVPPKAGLVDMISSDEEDEVDDTGSNTEAMRYRTSLYIPPSTSDIIHTSPGLMPIALVFFS